MDERRRVNFRGWVDKLVSALPRINGECAQVKFQSDYMVPAFVARQVSTQVTVTLLGKIILEQDRDAKLPMYCSEFAWHMLVLSNCTAEEIRNAPAEVPLASIQCLHLCPSSVTTVRRARGGARQPSP